MAMRQHHQLAPIRCFSASANKPPTSGDVSLAPKPTSGGIDNAAGQLKPGNAATYKPSAMDRRKLVWSGKYKSDADIPEYVQ